MMRCLLLLGALRAATALAPEAVEALLSIGDGERLSYLDFRESLHNEVERLLLERENARRGQAPEEGAGAERSPMSTESAEERWRPILGIEAILISVLSMLVEPNTNSPANIDAAVQFRDDFASFKKKVKKCVRKSQECAWD